MEWVQDALGNTSTASYDEWGNLVNKTSADGGFTQIQYDNKEYPYLPTSAIDAVGGRWTWEYDTQGNLTKRNNPLKAETQFDYTDGLPTTITGAKGEQTKLYFDNQGNLIETHSPDQGLNRWSYDQLGQCTSYQNARRGTTHYQYNLLGKTTHVELPDGNIRELKYDSMGNVIVAKDNNRFVSFSYRGVNKLATRTEKHATLYFKYDTEDQLRIVENENHEQYRFNLDPQGRVVEEIGFHGLTRKYRRDLSGRVTSILKPDGKEIAYEYDEVGRTTQVTYEDGSRESYQYRKDGLLTKAINEDAEVELNRDVLGRVIEEICNGESVKSVYDITGNRTDITSSLGADIQAEYNLMGDLIGLNSNDWTSQYKRDQFGLEIERMMSGDIQSHTQRDNIGRVTEQTIGHGSRQVSQKAYQWGVNDKLLSILDNGKETQFEYDQWGNLSKTTFDDGKTEYRNPDKAGNLFETLSRTDRKYQRGGQLIKTDKWEYKYDKEGNLIRKKSKDGQTWRYDWNQAGMLSKVTRPDAVEVSFKYDALGRRIEKSIRNTKTKWLWDGNTPLHEWKEVHIRDYNEEKGHFINIEKLPVTTWVFEDGTFVPTAKLTKEKKLSIVTNYMGTPEAMYDQSGEKTWECTLNSYGKVRNFKGDKKSDCPFRYQGQYEDAETGLYYNRFRYYSPDEGMYISQDPIRLNGGTSLYAYVNDPNDWVDVFGLAKNAPDGYRLGDVDRHGNLSPNDNRASGNTNTAPDNRVQSHHPVQDRWAQLNIEGYNRDDAPAILLESSSGKPHAQISAAQRADRRANGYNNSTLSQEMRKAYRDMINAGVPEDAAKKAIKDAYKYYDSLRDDNANNPCYDI